jgi:hypothetical protein
MSCNDKKFPADYADFSADIAEDRRHLRADLRHLREKLCLVMIKNSPQITQKIGVICGLICAICGKSYVL